MRVLEACASLTAAADLLRGMVFKVAEGASAEGDKVVIGALLQKRRTKVKAAAADMGPAIWRAAPHSGMPQTELLHAKFHVSELLGGE